MHIRRCRHLVAQLQTHQAFDLRAALRGAAATHAVEQWQLLSPHREAPLAVDAGALQALGLVGEDEWLAWDALSAQEQAGLEPLLQAGVVYSDQPTHAALAAAEQKLAQQHWHPLAAVYHRHTRWHDTDTVQAMEQTGATTAQALRALLGQAPPPAWTRRGDSQAQVALPVPADSALERLFAARVTCRNFDLQRPLALEPLASVLGRVFASRGQEAASQDTVFLKRSSPSGGGMHPLEAYLWVQRVEGLAPGLYHYRCTEHALAPLPAPAASLLQALAGQDWFASAPAAVVITARFARNFWKYRQHAKAYRALLLEAGHFSQSLYLAATEEGLGAWVTCAVNEAVLEQALGLEPMEEGVLAVCGLGWRDQEMAVMELDPAGAIWQPAG